MLPHPQQVSGYVSLMVVKSCPPPLCLSVVTPTQHSEGVTLTEGQLIGLLGRVVPESVHQAFVHHTQLFLYTWQRHRVFSVEKNNLNFLAFRKRKRKIKFIISLPLWSGVDLLSLGLSTDHLSVYITYHRGTENTAYSPPPFLHICLPLFRHR